MANSDSRMANSDRCPDCGASYALVGRTHLCRAVAVALPPPTKTRPANGGSPTYRYRDPAKRRAYMRDKMRKRRAGKI